MEAPAIVANDLNKTYHVYSKKWEKHLDFFLPMSFGARFRAIQNVSFSLEKEMKILRPVTFVRKAAAWKDGGD